MVDAFGNEIKIGDLVVPLATKVDWSIGIVGIVKSAKDGMLHICFGIDLERKLWADSCLVLKSDSVEYTTKKHQLLAAIEARNIGLQKDKKFLVGGVYKLNRTRLDCDTCGNYYVYLGEYECASGYSGGYKVVHLYFKMWDYHRSYCTKFYDSFINGTLDAKCIGDNNPYLCVDVCDSIYVSKVAIKRGNCLDTIEVGYKQYRRV